MLSSNGNSCCPWIDEDSFIVWLVLPLWSVCAPLYFFFSFLLLFNGTQPSVALATEIAIYIYRDCTLKWNYYSSLHSLPYSRIRVVNWKLLKRQVNFSQRPWSGNRLTWLTRCRDSWRSENQVTGAGGTDVNHSEMQFAAIYQEIIDEWALFAKDWRTHDDAPNQN